MRVSFTLQSHWIILFFMVCINTEKAQIECSGLIFIFLKRYYWLRWQIIINLNVFWGSLNPKVSLISTIWSFIGCNPNIDAIIQITYFSDTHPLCAVKFRIFIYHHSKTFTDRSSSNPSRNHILLICQWIFDQIRSFNSIYPKT